jgi:hypothetical protein
LKKKEPTFSWRNEWFWNISELKYHPFWVWGKISQRITCSIYYKKTQKTKKNPKRTSGFVGRYLIF